LKRFSGVSILVAIAGAALFAGCNQGASPSGKPGAATPGGNGSVEFVTQSGVEMVYLPGGRFTMGVSDGNPDEAPPHEVTISALAIDKFPVTQEMFDKAQLPNPSHWQGPRLPVERVRWRDAKRYCNERSLLEGLKPCYNEKTPDWDCDRSADGYRLPTEAEWEYAARAGSQTPYEFGAPEKLRQYAWFAENAERRTHPVGQKKPNRWGLYDLYGNVSQWCEDVYSPTYYQNSPAADPLGPPSPGGDVKRVLRGGNWKASGEACRVSYRQGERTGNSDACFATDICGFRCVRRIGPEALKKLKGPSPARSDAHGAP
jgi:formylglycine-generating enzyme required for sulfatase activity